MYRDRAIVDELEVLYSIPTLAVRRFRMRNTQTLDDLNAGQNESIVVVTTGDADLHEQRNSNTFGMGARDFCYLPPNDRFSVSKRSATCEILWASAPAAVGFDPYMKRNADCKRQESGSKDDCTHRVGTQMINRFDKSERLRMGYTEADKGSWTSFPPHRHDGIPEVYIFSGMKKGFGLGWRSRKDVRRQGWRCCRLQRGLPSERWRPFHQPEILLGPELGPEQSDADARWRIHSTDTSRLS